MFQWFYLSRWLWWPCILSCCAWLHLGSKFPHGGACCHRRDVDVICFLVWIFVGSQKTKLLLMLVCGNDIKRKMTLFEIILQPATKWQQGPQQSPVSGYLREPSAIYNVAHFMLILCMVISWFYHSRIADYSNVRYDWLMNILGWIVNWTRFIVAHCFWFVDYRQTLRFLLLFLNRMKSLSLSTQSLFW